MEGKLKIIVVVLVILLAVSFSIVFGIQNSKLKLLREYNYAKEKLTQENEKLTNKLNSMLAQNRDLQARLAAIQRDLERLTTERNQAQDRYELVNKEKQELLKKSNSYMQLQNDIESLKNENKMLEEQTSTLGKDKLALEADLNELRQENESLKQKIDEAKQILKEKALTEGRSIDLPPIVVSSQAVSPDKGMPPLLQGEIINVNGEYNFVVINLGQDRGLTKGMVFEVFREDKFLGKVEVVQTRSEIAACNIIQANIPFKTGDIVRY